MFNVLNQFALSFISCIEVTEKYRRAFKYYVSMLISDYVENEIEYDVCAILPLIY